MLFDITTSKFIHCEYYKVTSTKPSRLVIQFWWNMFLVLTSKSDLSFISISVRLAVTEERPEQPSAWLWKWTRPHYIVLIQKQFWDQTNLNNTSWGRSEDGRDCWCSHGHLRWKTLKIKLSSNVSVAPTEIIASGGKTLMPRCSEKLTTQTAGNSDLLEGDVF